MEDGVKRGGNLLGLPPRKRFKVLEQQRKEMEEESQGVDSSCSDITNLVPQRISPKKLTSQGFLVLEKQKYKSQQQKLQESFAQTLLPLPPRPVAVKRKDPPSILVPIAGGCAPPIIRLKSPVSSAFKLWGGPPKVALSETTGTPYTNQLSNLSYSELNEVLTDISEDSKHRSKRHQPEVSSTVSPVPNAETPTAWILAEGTICSTNRANEDVEMMVCDTLVSNSDVPVLEEDNLTKTVELVGTETSCPRMLLDLNTVISGTDDAMQLTDCIPDDGLFSDGLPEASQGVEASNDIETVMATVSSAPTVGDIEKDETRVYAGVPAEAVDGTPGLSMQSDFSSVTSVPHFSYVNIKTDGKLSLVDFELRNDDAKNFSRPKAPVNQDQLAVDEREVEEKERALRENSDLEEELNTGVRDGTTRELNNCPPKPVGLCTEGPSVVVLFENHGIDESSSNPNLLESATVFEIHTGGTDPLSACDECDLSYATKRQGEFTAAEIADTMHSPNGLSAPEGREQAIAALGGASAVIEADKSQKADKPQDSVATKCRLLSDLDEQTEKLFERMLKREGRDKFCVQPGRTNVSSQSFSDAEKIKNPDRMDGDNGNSTTEVEDPDQVSSHESDGQNCGVRRPEDSHEKKLQIPADHAVEDVSSSLQTQDSPNGSTQRDNDILWAEGQQLDCSLAAVSKNGGVLFQELTHAAVSKSSKEDGGWDSEMEIPNFSFGMRSGMTQRVKAPGRWTEKTSMKPTNIEGDDEEEGACDICCSADATPSDPIVYCDGCDVAVHADCYGNPLHHGIPEGDWFCAQCQSKSSDSRRCSLCPRSGGAMKKTTDGSWAHVSCAVFVPEVFYRKPDDMEQIDTSHVPSKRFLTKCCVCKSTGGACVDCTETGCRSSFHVSCALKKDLWMEFRNGRNGAIVISFCEEHTAAWDEQQESKKGRSKYRIVSRESIQSKKVKMHSKLKPRS